MEYITRGPQIAATTEELVIFTELFTLVYSAGKNRKSLNEIEKIEV